MNATTLEFYPGAGLPFITATVGAGGTLQSIDYLDFRQAEGEVGQAGAAAAYRLMKACQGDSLTTYSGEVDDQLNDLMHFTVRACGDELAKPYEEGRGRLRREAAIGFMWAITNLLCDVAVNGAWRASMIKHIARENERLQDEADTAKKRNDDLLDIIEPAVVAPPKVKKQRKVSTDVELAA